VKALVTGTAGFIGSHLTGALLDRGAAVVGIDCFTDYYPRPIKESNLAANTGRSGFTFVEARLQDTDLPALLDGVTHVYHLAAQAGVRKSWGRDFQTYTGNNVEASQQLLEACVGLPLHRFVYASSSSLYGDGEQTRDFTFVNDAVAATIAAGERGVPGRAYNIGGGSRVSVNDVLTIIEKLAGRPLDVRHEAAQKGDMRDTFADTSLARADLGFAPAVSLEEGLEAEYRWLSSTPALVEGR
jgi:nucleoside-diphosphate-sugar epimerase